MDKRKVGVLILLYLSSTFDTAMHSIPIKRIKNGLGLSDKAFAWFRCYLEGRFQQVKIGGLCSSKQKLEYGVPQESVLGPHLFNVYTAPLGRIIRAHGLECHFYAEDTQIYIYVQPVQEEMDNAVSNIQRCIN